MQSKRLWHRLQMKDVLISILRDRNTAQSDYRAAVEKLALLLAIEVSALLPKEISTIQTPIAAAKGYQFKNQIMLVPILRSGLALLHSFMTFFPSADVGFIGIYRDEKTTLPNHYYHKFPRINSKNDVIILEPMLATGGSLSFSVRMLMENGVPEENIIIANIIAAPEGLKTINHHFPKVRVVITQMDEKLNENKFIVPGLGDFGDRYFGTV